jgi:hypothetical protein
MIEQPSKIITKNHSKGPVRKSTFRHTIVPVQLSLCFSLIVQGDNESQGILPAEKSNSEFQRMKKRWNHVKPNPWMPYGQIFQRLP